MNGNSIVKRTLVFGTVVALLAVQAAGAASAAKGGNGSAGGASNDFTYVLPLHTMDVSPATFLPNAVPNCITNSSAVPSSPTLVCYSPDFVRTAYDFNSLYASGLDGSGRTIVLVDAYGSPTIETDLKFFDATFGLPDPPSFKVVCAEGCPKTNTNHFDPGGWATETSLDVEWAHALAPGADIVLVVAPSPAGNSLNLAVGYAVDHYPEAIVSQSFGIPEAALIGNNAQTTQAHANYAKAAASKMTVLASAGDDGATNGAYASANALFPSSDPYVLSIGGTQGGDFPYGLATYTGTCPTGFRPGYPGCTPTGYGSETTWNEAWDGISTGGAPSLMFTQPSYQAGLATGTTMRATPDVSMNAAVNGGVLVFQTLDGVPRWFVVGGTSASCPEWAALFAIVNQARGQHGHGPLGQPHAAIYALGMGASYSSDFHDITTGNNINVGSTVGFSAATGWDMATGWGTPDAASMVSHLA
jgi:subtilase family serine protease